MSNTPEGPGWWQATDGKWYHPDLAPPGYVPVLSTSGVADAPQGPGWWQATDGRWYDPRLAPPGYVPPDPEPRSAPPVPVADLASAPEHSASSRLGHWWFWGAAVVTAFVLAGVLGSAMSEPTGTDTAPTPVTSTTAGHPPTTRPSQTTLPTTTTQVSPSSTSLPSTTSTPPTTSTATTTTAPQPSEGVPSPATDAGPSCSPLTDAGNCYQPGELCRVSDHGTSGVAGDGESITCVDNNGWRWEPS